MNSVSGMIIPMSYNSTAE